MPASCPDSLPHYQETGIIYELQENCKFYRKFLSQQYITLPAMERLSHTLRERERGSSWWTHVYFPRKEACC